MMYYNLSYLETWMAGSRESNIFTNNFNLHIPTVKQVPVCVSLCSAQSVHAIYITSLTASPERVLILANLKFVGPAIFIYVGPDISMSLSWTRGIITAG